MAAIEGLAELCIICQSTFQEGEFENLYMADEQHISLSAAGELYEDLIGQLTTEKRRIFPQYLCHSCELQMKLFKRLKTKAYEALQAYNEMYEVMNFVGGAFNDLVLQETAKTTQPTNQGNKVVDFAAAVEEAISEPRVDTNETHVMPVNLTECGELENLSIPLEIDNDLIDECEDDDESNHEDLEDYVFDMVETHATKQDELDEQQQQEDHRDKLYMYAYQLELEQIGADEAFDESLTSSCNNATEILSKISTTEYLDEDSFDFSVKEEFLDEYEDVDYLESDVEKLVDQPVEELQESRQQQASTKKHMGKSRLKQKKDINVRSFARSHKCFACNMTFLGRKSFANHRQEAHFGKYPCHSCPKLFQSADAVRVHAKSHNGPAHYQCHLCPKTFNQKVHLNYHLAKHEDKRDYKCDQCEKGFISKSDLRIHQRIHTGKRSYFCETCGKDFLLLQHLKMHRYSHFERSFECPTCQAKFISPTTLRTHERSIHSTPKFVCEFCSKPFRRKHHLESHYKTHLKKDKGGKKKQQHQLTAEEQQQPQQLYITKDMPDDILEEQFSNANQLGFVIAEELANNIIVEDPSSDKDLHFSVSNVVDSTITDINNTLLF